MKILFLTFAFNSMAQRAWIELDRLNHRARVQIAAGPAVMEAAVEEFQPELAIAALQGNAGTGGVPLALAADKVLARNGIVLNPHTRTMGLKGSEYWTYPLPRRIGTEKAREFTEQCLPWGTAVFRYPSEQVVPKHPSI